MQRIVCFVLCAVMSFATLAHSVTPPSSNPPPSNPPPSSPPPQQVPNTPVVVNNNNELHNDNHRDRLWKGLFAGLIVGGVVTWYFNRPAGSNEDAVKLGVHVRQGDDR